MNDGSGEGPGAPPRSLGEPLPEPGEGIVVRHEEEIRAVHPGGWRGVGYVRARKRPGRARVDLTVARAVERAELERTPVAEGDSRRVETLDDGSISIPVFEEELVVTKRVVLKERIILRKRTETVRQRVVDELRKERVTVDADEDVRDRVRIPGHLGDQRREPAWADRSSGGERPETKPFFLTSEFLAAVLAVAGIAITAAASDAFGAWRAWILISAVTLGYLVSRGLAKARIPSHARDPRERAGLLP